MGEDVFSLYKTKQYMASINVRPVAGQAGEDTFNSASAVSDSHWNLDPTLLPAGYTYKIYSAVGLGGKNPRVLAAGAQQNLGNAADQLTAYMAYVDPRGNETRFTNAAPQQNGAPTVVWNPGQGMPGAPQPTVTISIVAEKPEEV